MSRDLDQTERVYLSLIVLTAEPFDPETALDHVAAEVDGREVVLTCRDGECCYVQLVAPETVDRRLGGLGIQGPVRFARVSPDGTSFTLTG